MQDQSIAITMLFFFGMLAFAHVLTILRKYRSSEGYSHVFAACWGDQTSPWTVNKALFYLSRIFLHPERTSDAQFLKSCAASGPGCFSMAARFQLPSKHSQRRVGARCCDVWSSCGWESFLGNRFRFRVEHPAHIANIFVFFLDNRIIYNNLLVSPAFDACLQV